MRIKIIEGMSLGKAIITTSIGTEGIDSINNKNIMIADSEMDFILSVEQLVNNEKLFNSISKNAVKFIEEQFDNNSITSQLVDFYQFQIDNII